jgi:hypothetical protein
MDKQICLLDKLTKDKKIEILRKNWMSHDAKSQMAIVQEFGWEKGNLLNKEIISEMGKVMMHRLKNALHITTIRNPDDFIDICSAAVDLYYPPPAMAYEFRKISENQLLANIKKCAVIAQVKRIGVSNFYECGCFAIRKGWYKALELKVKEECTSCIKEGDNECNIIVNVKKWNV